jgi:hypothetical protein
MRQRAQTLTSAQQTLAQLADCWRCGRYGAMLRTRLGLRTLLVWARNWRGTFGSGRQVDASRRVQRTVRASRTCRSSSTCRRWGSMVWVDSYALRCARCVAGNPDLSSAAYGVSLACCRTDSRSGSSWTSTSPCCPHTVRPLIIPRNWNLPGYLR